MSLILIHCSVLFIRIERCYKLFQSWYRYSWYIIGFDIILYIR